ncbi:ABC transporter substrate-binding protein [Bordetella sp. 2513F-2]
MSHPVFLRASLARYLTGGLLAAFLAVVALASPTPAQAAESGRIRIAEQYGIVYLLLNVVRDHQLIEKHARAAGLDVEVAWTRLSGGAAVNEALLSGAVDIGGAGVGPLLTLWDRTRGRQNVRGVASLGNFPYYLVSNNPKVRTLDDFTDQDRIAVPAVGVSVQSRILQMAAAKRWGDGQYNRLDRISVALPHPDAVAAILSGGTEITAHFGNPPFQEQELAGNPDAHVVLDSYEVLGGPSSATVLFATEAFRRDNPKTYAAFQAALAEAAAYVSANPEGAADSYLRVTGTKLDRAFLLEVIRNPKVQFKLAPQNTYALAEFMHRVGAIRQKPQDWRDYFFDDPVLAEGS